MNTVQHKRTTVIKHEIVMSGPITSRDIADFKMQVDREFKAASGRDVYFDDDYYVSGDAEGLTATFETCEQ